MLSPDLPLIRVKSPRCWGLSFPVCKVGIMTGVIKLLESQVTSASASSRLPARRLPSLPSPPRRPAPTPNPTGRQCEGFSECPEDKGLTGVGGGCGKKEGAQQGWDGWRWIPARAGKRGMKSSPPRPPLRSLGGGRLLRAPQPCGPGLTQSRGVAPPGCRDSTLASAQQLEAGSVLLASEETSPGAVGPPWVAKGRCLPGPAGAWREVLRSGVSVREA